MYVYIYTYICIYIYTGHTSADRHIDSSHHKREECARYLPEERERMCVYD